MRTVGWIRTSICDRHHPSPRWWKQRRLRNIEFVLFAPKCNRSRGLLCKGPEVANQGPRVRRCIVISETCLAQYNDVILTVTASKLCFSTILVRHWGCKQRRANLKIQVYLDVMTCWRIVTDVSIDNRAFVVWVKRSNSVYFALRSFETSVIICHLTQRNIPKDFNLQQTIKYHNCGRTGSTGARFVPSTVPCSWRRLSPEQCSW